MGACNGFSDSGSGNGRKSTLIKGQNKKRWKRTWKAMEGDFLTGRAGAKAGEVDANRGEA